MSEPWEARWSTTDPLSTPPDAAGLVGGGEGEGTIGGAVVGHDLVAGWVVGLDEHDVTGGASGTGATVEILGAGGDGRHPDGKARVTAAAPAVSPTNLLIAFSSDREVTGCQHSLPTSVDR